FLVIGGFLLYVFGGWAGGPLRFDPRRPMVNQVTAAPGLRRRRLFAWPPSRYPPPARISPSPPGPWPAGCPVARARTTAWRPRPAARLLLLDRDHPADAGRKGPPAVGLHVHTGPDLQTR